MNKRKIKNKKEHKQINNKPKTQYDRRYNSHTQTTTYERKINALKYYIHTNWPKHPRTLNPPVKKKKHFPNKKHKKNPLINYYSQQN